MNEEMGINRAALHYITKGELEFTFLATGALHTIRAGEILINQLAGNEIDGSLMNLYLRFLDGEKPRYVSLLAGDFSLGTSHAAWRGSYDGVGYDLRLKLAENSWFWDLTLRGKAEKVDLVYVQDIGLADVGALRSNEAYNSQYIDQAVFDDEGFVICSRQNQQQSTGFPSLESGLIGPVRADGFLTDGFQFFGRSYKLTGESEALGQTDFASTVYQYEMSLAVLKTEPFALESEKKLTFYGYFRPDQAERFTEPTEKSLLQEGLDRITGEDLRPIRRARPLVKFGRQLNGRALSNEELTTLYPDSSFHETVEGQLFSGFTPQNTHWVSQQKELSLEREQGEIFLSGRSLSVNQRGLATTSAIYGLFNAQTVLGNTTMNKLLSNQRNHLNLFKVAGQRIFVKKPGQIAATHGSAANEAYRMLGLPSTFEMGYNFARWRYELDDDTLIVTNFVAADEAALQLEVYSANGREYDYLLLNQVLLDELEYKSAPRTERLAASVYDFTAAEDSAVKLGNPALRYRLRFDQAVEWLDSSDCFDQPTFLGNSLALFELTASQWKLKITGALSGKILDKEWLNFETEAAAYTSFIEKTLLQGLHIETEASDFDRVNTILPWYAHDMLIHYLSPHGLEQYGGAAWGTRDLSQGPLEFFLATQHEEVAREILLRLYSHQFSDDGDWPQWFMFDEYQSIFSDDSHGDVIVWPLYALTEYLERTGDLGILDEPLPYVLRKTRQFSTERETLFGHLEREIHTIVARFLPGTFLSSYGNGDWDDTLQPADPALKSSMASSWTVALTYEGFKRLAAVLESYSVEEGTHLARLAAQIKADFERFLIIDGVIPGFVLQREDGSFEPVIHPLDQKTGLHYRLLPLDRSIVAELVSPAQLEKNLALIKEHLTFADGVRLMDHSPTYQGGVGHHFKRAEQAANFGREIGLLYVHAQIRYVETLVKAGRAQEAWNALSQIVPVDIHSSVLSAAPRQANTYFSSSDGAFDTRYEAEKNFDKLKTGEVAVKGGWRLYSSGPGIFTNQLISGLLGIKKVAGGLILDPVLPDKCSEVTVDFTYNQQTIKIHIVKSAEGGVSIDGQEIQAQSRANAYRPAGWCVEDQELLRLKSGSLLTVRV